MNRISLDRPVKENRTACRRSSGEAVASRFWISQKPGHRGPIEEDEETTVRRQQDHI